MVNKKAVVIASIIIVIIVGLIFAINVSRFNKQENINNDNENIIKSNTTTNSISEKNEINNNTNTNSNSNNTTESTNAIENKTTENNTTNTNESKNNNTTSNSKVEPEDIAIDLVKKKYGNKSSSVYFYVEDEEAKGVYIVSVRDKDTTAHIATYRADINKNTVTEEE